MKIAERIKGELRRQDWSYRDFAAASGVSPGCVSRILTGKARVGRRVAKKLAAHWGLKHWRRLVDDPDEEAA